MKQYPDQKVHHENKRWPQETLQKVIKKHKSGEGYKNISKYAFEYSLIHHKKRKEYVARVYICLQQQEGD